MTKEQLLFQIANIGYWTSYGRDKCYATSDIASKGTWRISIFGVYFAILAILFPILNTVSTIAFLVIGFAVLSLYLRCYTDEKYINAAIKLQAIERKLQNLYFNVKASDSDLSQYENELKKLDNQQKDIAISSQVLGSDLYAHIKIFWAKKINSQWFVDELKLKFFFDKLPFSFFLLCLLIIILLICLLIALFISNHLIEIGYATSLIDLVSKVCK